MYEFKMVEVMLGFRMALAIMAFHVWRTLMLFLSGRIIVKEEVNSIGVMLCIHGWSDGVEFRTWLAYIDGML